MVGAQSGDIKGKIFDAKTKEPLISASVKAGKLGTKTSDDGSFSLKMPIGKFQIEISYLGFETKFIDVSIVNEGEITLMIDLEESPTFLETTTVTAGKYETRLAESTISMEVIKPGLLESTNTTSVEQVLNKVPSVNVIDGQANIRGGSGFSYGAGSRVLLLVDDLPALQADAGYPNWGDIAIENIDQIEVIKGAASALYGSSAMNGLINIRTGYAKSRPITKVALFANTIMNPKDLSRKWWDTPPVEYGGSFLHKQKFNKLDLVLGTFVVQGDKFIKDTYDRYVRLTTGIRYRISDSLSIGINTNFNKGKSKDYFLWEDGEANAYKGMENSATSNDKFRFTIDPFLNYFDKHGNRHKILGRWNYIDNKNSNNQQNSSSLWYGEYQFQRNFKPLDLIFTVGIAETYSSVNAKLYGDTTYHINNTGVYLQADKKLGDRLTLSFGARYEYNAIYSPEIIGKDTIANGVDKESKPVFRLGMNYKMSDGTFLRASWGQGYRFPTIAEKFISTQFSSFPVLPNPKLTSETGWTAEIGLKQGFKISDWYGFADVSTFWTEYNNMMEFTFLGLNGFQSRNVGNTIIKGYEITCAADGRLWGMPTTLLAGYTYIDPKFKTFTKDDDISSSADYNILKYRFKHSLKFDIEPQYHGFSLGLSCIYNSNMEAIDQIFNVFIKGVSSFRASHNTGFTILGVRMGYAFNNGLKTSILLNNLLNTEYTWRPAKLEPPRNISIRIEYNIK